MPSPSRRHLPFIPLPTDAPSPSTSSLRKRKSSGLQPSSARIARRSPRPFALRDIIADDAQVTAAENTCQVLSSNAVISCFPLSNTSIPQHEVASFVWNSRLPQITQTNLVNVYLLDAVSQTVLQSWINETNPTGRAGIIRFPVNDTWFGTRGEQWDGQPTSFLFYWMITRSDAQLDSGIPQPIFTAVQTTFADSVAAAMSTSSVAAASSRSAAAAAASSASVASLSSVSAASLSSLTASSSATSSAGPGSGNVQNDSGGSSFPHWAIAVIVILGALALVATGILTFFIMRRIRRRRGASLSHRGSMGSSTPMMAHAQTQNTQSPLLGAAALAAARPHSPDVHDGASTISRGSDSAPFSGADAAVMATAFRDMLRKPNFQDQTLEEGGSPDELPDALINRELAEEGRDIRSVSSSRGVKVETLNGGEDTDTVQDHPH